MENKTKVMGILNITPDSFSGDGLLDVPETLEKRLKRMLEAKPDIIDIGAVSTRPYKDISKFPTVEEEFKRFERILSIIVPILKSSSVQVSIDSSNAKVVEYLLDKLPIAIVNDQSSCADAEMIDLVKNTDLKLSIMHHLILPTDPKIVVPEHLDVVEVVKEYLLKKAEELVKKGIRPEQIILDPGIGFGKTANQSWQLIKSAREFVNLDFPVLYGYSRKSFFSLITDKVVADRDLETSVLSLYLANCGVDILRVHDVESTKRTLQFQTMDLTW